MVQPRKVKRGDAIRADEWNALVDAVARKLSGNFGGPLGGLGGALGVPQTPSPFPIRLVQAIERAEKSNDNPEDEFGNGGQVWSQECFFVNIRSGNTGYFSDADDGTVRVYFPTHYRKLEGGGEQGTLDHPPTWHQTSDVNVQAGARFWAIFNVGSGRWEYLGPPNQIIRFKLLEDLTAGGNALARCMWSQVGTDAPSVGEQIRVYDWLSTSTAQQDDLGYAVWFPDLGRWEAILSPGDSSGWLEKPIEYYDVNQTAIATDAATTLLWDFVVNYDPTAYTAGTGQAGNPPPGEYISLLKTGLYRIGATLQFTTAGTSADNDGWSGNDLQFILGRAYMTYDDGGGEVEIINTSTYLSLTYNKETATFNAGNASIYTWWQTTGPQHLRLKVENASHATAHPFSIGGNFWAVWLNHNVTPSTEIVT